MCLTMVGVDITWTSFSIVSRSVVTHICESARQKKRGEIEPKNSEN